jgi:trans-L-3-hydroxyproline dehydratase
LIHARGSIDDKGSINAEFECVPSFVAALDQKVYIDSIEKEISYDVAYGGAFYAYVDARQLDLKLNADSQQQLINLGKEIKAAVNATSDKFVHPFEADLGFNYGTIFIGSAEDPDSHSRNVCIFADGEVDRSPTGSGVSGRAALHYAKGEIEQGQTITIESIIGSKFSVEVARTTQYGELAAVIPKVCGTAHICGTNRFIISPNDPLKHGFLMR